MTAGVELPGGYEALVDDVDLAPVAAAGPWFASAQSHTTYAVRSVRRPDGSSTTQTLHGFLTGWPIVDHRDGNGLNNQRANLRAATTAQNNANAGLRSDNSSGFKGVSWIRRDSRWQATISVESRSVSLGHFETAEEAALAYDAAALLVQGEFARPNFPGPPTAERLDAVQRRLSAAGHTRT